MQRTLFRRGVVGIATAALATAALASPPPSSAVIEWPYVEGSVYTNDYTAQCTVSPTGDPTDKPFSDNGVPVSSSYTESATVTKNDDPADVSTVQGAASATVSATPLGQNVPGEIKGSASASASASAALGAEVTGCEARVDAYGSSGGEFAVPQPMWATITASGNASGHRAGGDAYLETAGGTLSVELANRSSGSVTALIPAGRAYFGIEFEARAHAHGSTPADRASASSGSVTIRLTPVGHPSAAAGKAKGTVVLGARSCSTGNIAAALTKKAKKKATSVVVTVNGAKRAKFVKKKLKKRAFSVPAARTAPATVVAKITLKSGKKLTLTRSYLAC